MENQTTQNYVCYHLHSELSLLDSCTNHKEYTDLALKLGQKAIAFTEHGNLYHWVEKKQYCDKLGIKYIHGVECYLTQSLNEKVRDNYHTILLAKNFDGVQEINLLVDKSTQADHFYYKPRITFDEFLNISDNVIKISACLASPLHHKDEIINYYDLLCKKYDYYEIQPHYCKEQVDYNCELINLAKLYNKPLIMATDTHNSTSYKSQCREILMKYKKQSYGDEDSFDLTYKSYDEIVTNIKKQKELVEKNFTFYNNYIDICINALNNTNVMADLVSEFKLDISMKYPKFDNEEETLKRIIFEKYKEKLNRGEIDFNPQYKINILEELRVFKKINMIAFMLFMSKLISWCKENGIPVGFGRGSVAGSTIAYISDITDVDPVKRGTVFSRFANEDRVESGDIDSDFFDKDRELVYKHIIDGFGQDYTAYVLALMTIADKATIDVIGGALDIPLKNVKDIKEFYNNDVSENHQNSRDKYPELFYYFDGLVGTTISQSMHPAGIVISPVTLTDNFGTFWQDNKKILDIDMEECHDINLIKYDILGLKNVGIIKETCKLANIPYPKAYQVNWEDKDVWEHMTDSRYGLFQFESQFAFDSLKKFKPTSVYELNLVTASIRPSGTSYRDRLLNREFNKNPSEQINKMLEKSYGFLVFQEQTIQFLQEICGLSGSQADNIRRAIGRKKIDVLQSALPSILEGYCKVSPKPRDIAEEEAKAFLKIIEDSSSYQFGLNHSEAYSMLTYVCAYLRYYYPLEFVTTYLNLAEGSISDITNGTELANSLNIKICDISFGKSKGTYAFDKNINSIYKGIGSLKGFNKDMGDKLYDYYHENVSTFANLNSCTTSHKNFMFLKSLPSLIEIVGVSKMKSLITLNYFSIFGFNGTLLKILNLYDKYNNIKTISKSKDYYLFDVAMLSRYCEKESEKQFSKFNNNQFLEEQIVLLKNEYIPLPTILAEELAVIGELTYTNSKFKDYYYILDMAQRGKSKIYVLAYDLSNGNKVEYFIKNANKYKEQHLEINSVFELLVDRLDKKWKLDPSSTAENKKWIDSGLFEKVLVDWKVVYTPPNVN